MVKFKLTDERPLYKQAVNGVLIFLQIVFFLCGVGFSLLVLSGVGIAVHNHFDLVEVLKVLGLAAGIISAILTFAVLKVWASGDWGEL